MGAVTSLWDELIKVRGRGLVWDGGSAVEGGEGNTQDRGKRQSVTCLGGALGGREGTIGAGGASVCWVRSHTWRLNASLRATESRQKPEHGSEMGPFAF